MTIQLAFQFDDVAKKCESSLSLGGGAVEVCPHEVDSIQCRYNHCYGAVVDEIIAHDLIDRVGEAPVPKKREGVDGIRSRRNRRVAVVRGVLVALHDGEGGGDFVCGAS